MLLVKTKLGPSKIHGIGLFADQFIPKGTVTWRIAPGLDLFIDEDEFNLLPEHTKEHFLNYAYIDKNSKMMVLCFDNERFMNHSDDPNIIEGGYRSDFGSVDIAARDIQPGEEMLCNYNEFDGDANRKLSFGVNSKRVREVKLGTASQKMIEKIKKIGVSLKSLFKSQIKNNA